MVRFHVYPVEGFSFNLRVTVLLRFSDVVAPFCCSFTTILLTWIAVSCGDGVGVLFVGFTGPVPVQPENATAMMQVMPRITGIMCFMIYLVL
jgi:hypothetical protein